MVSIKYLGVQRDDSPSFNNHEANVAKKASIIFGALSQIIPNVGKSKSKSRIMLSRVISSILLYAAPVWSHALNTKSFSEKVQSIYRQCTLRVCSGCRTVFNDAVCVIAGMVSINILADEMSRLYSIKAVSILQVQE